MQTTETIWSSVLSLVAGTVRPEQLETWFKGVSLIELTADCATIRVPNAFYSKWFQIHYRDMIADALRSELGVRPEIRFEVAQSEPRPQPAVEPGPAAPLPLHTNPDLRLNGNYLFSTFVTGPSNQLAHAAALATVESPGLSYNPLFLHGGVGLGKTHLIHAAAHAMLKRRPGLHIRYLSCESFMNQFIYAIQKGGLEQFRARYRQVDALMIDDIHILAKRPRTQEEFFHTFNELYNAHKQIILSSDSAPEDIPAFEERLISRFKWGLVARIDLPCVDTRIAIIHKKAELRGRVLAEDVVEFIAQTVPSNVRELEGAVLKVIGYASLMNRPADLALAREVLRTAQKPQAVNGPVTVEKVQQAVARFYGLNIAELQGKTRARSVAFPRQVTMYLIRRLTNKSLEEVGRAFGGRDHSTVAHACARIERELAAEAQFNGTLESLIRQIKTE